MELDWLRALMFVKQESGFELAEIGRMQLRRYFALQHECIERAKQREKELKRK